MLKKIKNEDSESIKHDQNPEWYLGSHFKVHKNEEEDLVYSAYMVKSKVEKSFC